MFKGCFVAIVTPFKKGEIDEEALRKNIQFCLNKGVDGIVPCGTTGESPTLSFDEHKKVIKITINEVKGKVPVIAGTGSNSTKEAEVLTRFATTEITPIPPKERIGKVWESFPERTKKLWSAAAIILDTWSIFPLASLIPTILFSLLNLTTVAGEIFTPVREGTLYIIIGIPIVSNFL